MNWETTLPATVGYLAGLLYNQNNIASESGPVTSLNTYGEVVELSAIVGSGNCTGVEFVDSTFATLNYSKARNVVVQGNTFNAISEPIYNPCILEHSQASDTQT